MVRILVMFVNYSCPCLIDVLRFISLVSIYKSLVLIVVAGEENFNPTSLVLPDEALEKCKKPFATKECKASKEMSGVDVTYGSGDNRHSTRLRNINVFHRKQQPASRGPRKHPNKKLSSTSTEAETRDSDTAISENVSANLQEISSDGKYLDMFVNDRMYVSSCFIS